jgi:single-strand DNA-binding protein
MQTYTGNLTADATGKDLSGSHVTNFTLALNRRIKRDGEWVDKVTYLRCALWNNAGAEPYLTKGKLLHVTGHTQAGAFIDNNQNPVGYLQLTVADWGFLNSPQRQEGPDTGHTVPEETVAGSHVPDDLPF